MRKVFFHQKFLSALVFIGVILFGFMFYHSYTSFQFNQDMIWRIDEERREHSTFLFRESLIVHNKLSSFIYLTLGIYLLYLSPLALFSQTSSFIFNLLLFGFFFYGIAVFLKSKLKIKKVLGFWVLVYPAFLVLNISPPDKDLIIPITIPFVIIGFISLINNIFSS